MRALTALCVLLLAAEAPALACSCAEPANAAEARMSARELVRGAAGIVEVDVLSVYDQKRRQGELVRVRRTLAGRAPRSFRVYRPQAPNSAGCDLTLDKGQRRVLVIYPASSWWGPKYRIHNLCSDAMVRNRQFLAVVVEEARRR